MSSPQHGEALQRYSCRCSNVAINAYKSTAEPPTRPESGYERAFVGEEGISITHHYLTLRIRDRAQESTKNKLIQHLALSCLACKTLVYRVAQEISPGAEAREGPVVPTEDWVEQETLRSKSGWIQVFVGRNGCLVGKKAIEQHLRSITLSRTFSIGVLEPPPTAPTSPPPVASPPPHTWSPSSPDDSAHSTPTPILPSLPPLFPPPPFTPSHPVFVSLSARAIDKSTELRVRAEEDTRNFVQAQLAKLEKEETQLRRDVEGIWRGYREGWKEVLGRVNEERRRTVAAKPEGHIPTASAKSGVPMSIRDFSPIVRSHPQPRHLNSASSQSVRPPSPSLLSASIVQSGAHFPPAASQSPEADTSAPDRTSHSSLSHAPDSTIPLPPPVNGARSYGSSSSMSIKAHSDVHMPGAFKRNMDTNVDIASSVAWAQGEEELRRRFGGGEDDEPRERARKRTSKNLGIGAVEKKPNANVAPSAEQAGQPASAGRSAVKSAVARQSAPDRQIEARGPSPDADLRSPMAGSLEANGASRKSKRRVTFDDQPEVTTIPEAKAEHPRKHVDEVELFDLDDLSSTEPFPESDLLRSSKPARPQPVVRTPSRKLHPNDGASRSQELIPASLPAPRVMPPRSPVAGNPKWTGGSVKRSVGLADALPLLSSSVPAGDRILAQRPPGGPSRTDQRKPAQPPRTPSPPTQQSASTSQTRMISTAQEGRTPSPAPPSMSNGALEPAEAELKNLLAASAPSHRHAWREGGRAWEMFHQRSRDKKKARGAITEEDSDGTVGSLEEGSDDYSDEENTIRGPWQNPSQFPSSLPIQIRPLAQYQPNLEPKTSLADKQGVLVPPLKVTNLRSTSSTAFRRAVYAERDRARSIDPGPTLDFSEQEETEDDDTHEEIGEGGRGRRHALSILQARSVVPEAGMWRSMA